jgi:hypothetical protein
MNRKNRLPFSKAECNIIDVSSDVIDIGLPEVCISNIQYPPHQAVALELAASLPHDYVLGKGATNGRKYPLHAKLACARFALEVRHAYLTR